MDEEEGFFLQTSVSRQLIDSLTSSEGLRFAIVLSSQYNNNDIHGCILQVVAHFNEIITKTLLEGILDTFKKYSIKEEDVDALDCAGGKFGNKGVEAALTAIEMPSLFEHHLKF